ncbi:hypothetical protein EDD18DRAFT_1364089 [Armillaria luteobubalina]|uniref:Uncharacterized protein n=1 Tax=Armillaria luteobubalina TaxID=153913 RepID=A0AA39PA11_9AGAR|nr:hypothetical protein EDD18DRAFT_1364089 [Armillaria luteobubalina]
MAPHLRSFAKALDAPFLLPANLVEFEDSNLFNKSTRATIHNLVNIKYLSFVCSSYSSGLPHIHLPRLSQLELCVYLSSVGDAFVTYNHFELPFLTHLQMILICSQMKIPTQVFQPISSSTVSSLVLAWFHYPPRIHSVSDIELDLSLLCTMPNLQFLTVKDCSNINLFLGGLSILSGKKVIFPKMSTLDINCEHNHDLSEGLLDMHILVELLQSRRDHGALREFYITWERGLVNDDADTCSRWEQLSAPGGGIQISAFIEGGVTFLILLLSTERFVGL